MGDVEEMSDSGSSDESEDLFADVFGDTTNIESLDDILAKAPVNSNVAVGMTNERITASEISDKELSPKAAKRPQSKDDIGELIDRVSMFDYTKDIFADIS